MFYPFWFESLGRRLSYFCSMLFLLCCGVSRADEFPEIYNSEKDATAVPMPAEEAAASMQLPEGLKAQVFAAEPDVQNPIGMAWDSRGRMWVAENYTYAERTQRFDLGLRDRVIILEDSDGDGQADDRKVFTDQVQMLTSVEVGQGGVWLMCPPNLLFIPDANHDDKPDGSAIVVLDGFEVANENYHNFANGLRWGPDGWLYGRCGGSCPGRIGIPGTPEDQRVALEGGIWRFHPQRKLLDVLCHGTTNPWGMDWNSVGEAFFVNTVNGHLWHLIPGAHYVRPFTLDPNTKTYELIDMHADHWHFDTGQSWTASRDGSADSLGGGHAHSGAMIYLGDDWPDIYRDRLLTLNFHGRRANQEILRRSESGYVASHGEDMLIAADPFFRGIDISYGRDGAVYVLDWSDTGECHESTGVHRSSGRIFRISNANPTTRQVHLGDWNQALTSDLVLLHFAKNEWVARQARQILTARHVAGTLQLDELRSELLRAICRCAAEAADKESASTIPSADAEMYCLRALATLHAIGGDSQTFLLHLLDNDSEAVRSTAVKYLTDYWPIDDCYGVRQLPKELEANVAREVSEIIEALVQQATNDPSNLVRLSLASSLQRLPVSQRLRLAAALVSHADDAEDHNLPLLVWYGLMPVATQDPSGLAKLALACKWPKTQRLITRRLAEDIELNADPINRIVSATIASKDTHEQINLLQGIEDGLRGWKKAPQPPDWLALFDIAASSHNPTLQDLVRSLSVVFGDGRALEDLRQIVLDEKAEINLRRSSLETMVANRVTGLDELCRSLLSDPRINVVAAGGLAASNQPDSAKQLIKHYGNFRAPNRPKIIELLCSRATFANELLDAIDQGKIPVRDLTAYDVRQIRSLEMQNLTDHVTKLWGDIRESSVEKTSRFVQLKSQLSSETLALADKSRGRLLFEKSCIKCHRLYGHGERIGPELTGANRNNLDYLLENIIDPSAVVNKDYRMSIVLTTDDRVLNGLIISRDEKMIALQTQTELMTLPADEVDSVKSTSLSPMPDGLFDSLAGHEIRDLIGYLMHPVQVELPN